MLEVIALTGKSRRRRVFSFTLIELLAVMAIISILAGLFIYAGVGLFKKTRRNRAASEIQALTTALDAYKVDNGGYPNTNVATSSPMSPTLLTNSVAAPYLSTTQDGTGTVYINNAQILFLCLTGMTNFTDIPAPNVTAYINLKRNQVADSASGSYVIDPWNYAYGYSVGTPPGVAAPSYPYNGNGFFDLWSTGGTLVPNNTPAVWISNWQTQ